MARRRGEGNGAEAAAQRRSLRPLRLLLPYVLRRPGHLIGGAVAILAAALATLAVPLAVRQMIDHGFGGSDPAAIDRWFLLLIGVVAVLAAASALRFYFVTWLGERVVADLRSDVFAHIAGLGIDFFDRSQSGEIVSRLTADTTQLKATAGANLSVMLRNLVLFAGAVAMMLATSPRLSALVLAAIPVVVLPLVAFGRAVRGRSRAAQDRLAGASALAAEAIGGMRMVQAYGLEPEIDRGYRGAVTEAFEAARRSTAARALLTACGIFLVFASIVAVLWYGAQDVLAGRLSPGTLGQFLFYAVFAAGALGELSSLSGDLAQAAGAAERLAELLAERPSIRPPAHPVALPRPARGAVAFEGVSFAYAGREAEPALDRLSFQASPGERLAIVGPSGAGKSTIFALLLRFYDPTAGRVLLDGVDLRDLDLSALRRSIALVPQDVTVFAASAAENIRLGRPDADDRAVRRAAEAAHAAGFIERLPDGYGTLLGERGVALSGGERQRIAIARAVLRDAPILLLDEATSALDAESEALVQAALDELMEGRTTLAIAHRLATVRKAARVLVVDRGRLVEEGSHEALSGAGGLYQRLALLQFRQPAQGTVEPGGPARVLTAR